LVGVQIAVEAALIIEEPRAVEARAVGISEGSGRLGWRRWQQRVGRVVAPAREWAFIVDCDE